GARRELARGLQLAAGVVERHQQVGLASGEAEPVAEGHGVRRGAGDRRHAHMFAYGEQEHNRNIRYLRNDKACLLAHHGTMDTPTANSHWYLRQWREKRGL